MSDTPATLDSGAAPGRFTVPTWWLVFIREMADLWIGGKALVLIFIYSLIVGVITYVMAANSELSLIPPKEMVYETLKIAIAIGGIIGLIIGADSISGERERATLEGLLLTPTSRRQIVLGKFLAASSPWPAALLIAAPYLAVLAQGDEVFGQALLWGGLLGSLVAPALTGVGMLVSFWCNTNKTSMFVSLTLYLMLLVPAQLPGRAQTGVAGQFLQWVNPLAAANHFLSKILTNNRTVEEFRAWLVSPLVFLLIVVGLLFLYASPGLRLEAGRKSRFWSRLGRAVGLSVLAAALLALSSGPALAFQGRQAEDIQVTIDRDAEIVRAGDAVLFNTTIKNTATEMAPPLIVAMNLINLDAEGEIVDPEDWSPERTQYIASLAAGQSATLAWRVNTILDGDYMVYMVVIPQPDDAEETSQPVASSGIHLTVTPYSKLNPRGVLPFTIGVPLVLLLSILFLFRLRRQGIDSGGE